MLDYSFLYVNNFTLFVRGQWVIVLVCTHSVFISFMFKHRYFLGCYFLTALITNKCVIDKHHRSAIGCLVLTHRPIESCKATLAYPNMQAIVLWRYLLIVCLGTIVVVSYHILVRNICISNLKIFSSLETNPS